MSSQQHAPAALYPQERHGTHFTEGWVGPRAGLDGRKISSLPAFDPGPSSPYSVAIPTELPGPQLKRVPGIFHGRKGGRCLGLTLPPSCADCLEIWDSQLPENLWAPTGTALPFTESDSLPNWGLGICASNNGRGSTHNYSHSVLCFVCFVSAASNTTRIVSRLRIGRCGL